MGIDGFNNGTTGSWEAHSSTISNEDDRLKVVLSDADVGVFKIVSAAAGETLAISLDVDKGTTDKVSLYEYGAGKLSDLVDGYNQINYTPTVSGDFILLIVKDPTSNDVGTQTHFYLDNIGVTIGEEELVIVEENNFYPFGLKHRGYNNVVNGTHHPYGYNGKEENDELGLQWLDFDTRNYDAALGRWMNIDPLAEEMRRFSPYTFAFNNPIYYIDPDGMMPIGLGQMDEEKNFDFSDFDGPQHITSTVVNNKGEIIDYKDDGDNNIYLNERSEENIIGTEQDGVDYKVGDYLELSDLNEDAVLPDGFLLMISREKIEPTLNYFWAAELLEVGWLKLINGGKYLITLNKYKKLLKESKFMQQLVKQLEKDGSKSIVKSYNKILRRLKEHKDKLNGGLEYSSSVEREINTFSKQIKELEVFMTKHNIKF